MTGLIFGIQIFAPSNYLPINSNLISLNSKEGKELLVTSSLSKDYLPLSIHFISQKKPSYCGIAAMAMILNSCSFPISSLPQFGNSHAFTQDNIVKEQITNRLYFWKTYFLGTTIEQIRQFIKAYNVTSEIYYAQLITLDEFRNTVKINLDLSNRFVLVNYSRKILGQKGIGHFSPIAAYNQKTDRFLILDVARHKYPPVWVKANHLYSAMQTIDFESKKSRGFIIVCDNK